MTVPLEGGARSILLAGDLATAYSYACPRIQGKSCVLGEIQGKQLIFSFLDTVHGKGAEIQRVDINPDSIRLTGLFPQTVQGSPLTTGPNGWIRILTIADHKSFLFHEKETGNLLHRLPGLADGKHLFATAWSDHFYRQAILSIDLEGNAKID